MIIKPLKYKIARSNIPLFFLLIAAIAFSASPVPSAGRTVAVIKSSEIQQYQEASRIIVEQLGNANEPLTLLEYTYKGNGEDDTFWRDLSESGPELVVTVGSPATRSAMVHCGDLPLVYTMVFDNIEQLQAERKNDFAGITLNIPVEVQLEYLNKTLPDARRVGLIYSVGNESIYEEAHRKARSLGISLEVEIVNSAQDIPNALRRMLPEIDAFWLPPDNLTLGTYLAFSFIATECFKNRVPIVSVYRNRAEAGIPITVGVDYEDIGRQTAELVIRRIENGRFRRPVIDAPRKYVLFVNQGVASRLNIEIPEELQSLTVAF